MRFVPGTVQQAGMPFAGYEIWSILIKNSNGQRALCHRDSRTVTIDGIDSELSDEEYKSINGSIQYIVQQQCKDVHSRLYG